MANGTDGVAGVAVFGGGGGRLVFDDLSVVGAGYVKGESNRRRHTIRFSSRIIGYIMIFNRMNHRTRLDSTIFILNIVGEINLTGCRQRLIVKGLHRSIVIVHRCIQVG